MKCVGEWQLSRMWMNPLTEHESFCVLFENDSLFSDGSVALCDLISFRLCCSRWCRHFAASCFVECSFFVDLYGLSLLWWVTSYFMALFSTNVSSQSSVNIREHVIELNWSRESGTLFSFCWLRQKRQIRQPHITDAFN